MTPDGAGRPDADATTALLLPLERRRRYHTNAAPATTAAPINAPATATPTTAADGPVETAGAGALNDAHNAMITLSTGHASMHVQLQSVPQDGVGLTDATDALERLTVGERVGEGGATTASESSRDDDDRESVTASLDGLGDSDGVGVGVTEGVLDGDATVPLMDSANRKPAVVEAEL